MKKHSRVILLFLIPFLIVIFLFSIFIYATVSNYSEDYLFRLLEARAKKVAKEKLVRGTEFPEEEDLDKLPHERDFFIPINNQLNIDAESQKVGINKQFFKDVIEEGEARFATNKYLYKGIKFQSNKGNFIVITVAENYFEINQAENLIKTMLFAISAAFLLLLYIAVYYSKNIFKPISAITEKVKEISSENLHLRLSEDIAKDELSELTGTFNNMLDRIETSFETQNNFISNASHELRTPLTAIIGEADVVLTKTRSTEEYVEALKIILQEAEKLDNKTKALLFLAQTGFNGKVQKFEKIRIDQLIWDVKEKS